MKKLLIVVDYQKDFVDGSLGFEAAIKLDDYISELIDQFHKNNNDVYHIEYVKPKILNNEKIIEKHDLVMQAETKKEVEERMEDKGAKVKVTRVEKLVHTKVNKEKKNKNE